MVRLLFRKMCRDMRRSAAAYLICTVIVAIGLCGYSVLSISMDHLENSKDYFFKETAWCDGFAQVQQAPLGTAERLMDIPGVRRAEGRLVLDVPVRGMESDETRLRLISVTEEGMNRPLIEEGEMPREDQPELAVGNGFFKAHGLSVGDKLTLAIHGQERELSVCGNGISPENIYMVQDLQEMLPAVDRYDAAFMPYASMAELFGQQGLANQFLLELEAGTEFEDVKEEIEKVLKSYGVISVYESGDDLSVSVLNMELEQVGKVSASIPFFFLGVSAMILYIMLHRLLEQQRVQLGTLLAVGINPLQIRLHYTAYGLTVGAVGGILGGVLGSLCAGPMTAYYRVFFQLPDVSGTISVKYLFLGVFLAGIFCAGTAWLCAGVACRLSPSEALRPPAPSGAHQFFLERVPGFLGLFTQPGIMALRSLARHKRRAFLSVFGIACAFMVTASLVSMNTLFDVFLFDELEKNQQQDITVHFAGLVKEDDALEAVKDSRVERAEGLLSIPVNLKTEKDEMDVTVDGISEDSVLRRMYDGDGNALFVRREGIVLSEFMAERLGVKAGDWIDFTVSYPRERVSRIPVTGITAQYLGSTAYMSKEALGDLTDYRGVVNGVLLKAPEEVQEKLKETLRESPLTGTIETRQEHIDQYRSLMGSMAVVMSSLALMGVLIGLAVIYTSSLIYYEELKREISTLMLLGLKSRQCLEVISVGQWVLTIGGILLGIPMSMWASRAISRSMGSEMYVIPDFVDGPSLALAVVLTLLAVWFSSWMILRKLKKIEPVELLRERE